jgi:glycosyltransferase involved in cell wall biosynthesis
LENKKIYFLTIAEAGYSRSWHYYKGLLKLGEPAEFIRIDSKKLIKTFKDIRKKTSKNDIFVVMSPSHYLVPITRIFLSKNVYLDAGWSLFEGSIISRQQRGFLGLNILKTYFIDITASIFAKQIFLESFAQKAFYCKMFLVRKNKCAVIYTGIDEQQFELNRNFQTPIDFFNNAKTVLFRGKHTAEAGLEVLAQATMILESEEITFWIFSPEIPKNLQFSRNTVVVTNFIQSKRDLATIYCKAALTLGQLSNHPRLNRTIPHKAFESAFFSKPYLSARVEGILELFNENQSILCFTPGDSSDLARKISKFFTKSCNNERIGTNMRKKYDSDLSQTTLSNRLFKSISGID